MSANSELRRSAIALVNCEMSTKREKTTDPYPINQCPYPEEYDYPEYSNFTKSICKWKTGLGDVWQLYCAKSGLDEDYIIYTEYCWHGFECVQSGNNGANQTAWCKPTQNYLESKAAEDADWERVWNERGYDKYLS